MKTQPVKRTYLHAAVIAARAGRVEKAGDWIVKVAEVTSLLLPIELEQLQTITPSDRILSAVTAGPPRRKNERNHNNQPKKEIR
jgi:hypothetical protein